MEWHGVLCNLGFRYTAFLICMGSRLFRFQTHQLVMAVAAAARQLCAHVDSSYSSRSSGVGESSQAVWKGLAFVAQCSGSSLSLRASNYAAAGHVMLPKRVTMNQLGVVEREGTGQVSSAKAAQIDSVQQQPNAATFNPTFSSIVEKAVNKSTHAGPFSVQKVLSFVKYQGLGNDFLLVDNRDSMEPKISEEEATRLCDRNFGVGGDGVIFLMPGVNGSDYSMRIFNSDGSEPEMCGNGIRCLARFIAELENTTEPRSYNVHTLAGAMIPKLREDGQVVVDMGPPILNPAHIPTKLSPTKDGAVVQAPLVVDGKTWSVTCVSMGNPHCVTYGEQGSQNFTVEELPLSHLGPLFENHEVFPARINTHFVEVLSRSHVRMRVWERGAGPTLACGTGACALVVAGVLEGRIERACTVNLPGGPLEIEWNEKDNHVYMTGPGTAVFSGKAFL